MSNAKVTGLRGIELGVTDLSQSAAFYGHIWGLEPVVSENDTVHLRANGGEHHIVTLRERPQAGMLGVHFAANDRVAVDELHARAKAFGADVLGDPADLLRSAGGGYGFGFRTPEGHVLNISSDVAQHPNTVVDRSKPTKLSHVVLNSARIDEQTKFFIDLLGFKHSDSTDMMDFIRCCADHHSVAFARGNGPSLNHMAYEVANIDGLMRGPAQGERLQHRVGCRPPRPGGQRVHLLRRAERLRGGIHHRGRAGRRGDLHGARRRILAQLPDAALPLGHGRASVQSPQGRVRR
jgi:catechol 2,3-dioxygenase-like lactoylglutathione lyase family enzyme